MSDQYKQRQNKKFFDEIKQNKQYTKKLNKNGNEITCNKLEQNAIKRKNNSK